MERHDSELIHELTELPIKFDAPLKFELSQFEQMLEKLGLSEQECIHSAGMRAWCKTHRNSHYVPEWVLQHFKLEVSHDHFGPESPLALSHS